MKAIAEKEAEELIRVLSTIFEGVKTPIGIWSGTADNIKNLNGK